MTPPRSTSLPTSPSPFAVMGSIWVICDGHAFLGRGRVALLEEIASTGSISQAAKHMGMSYKKAWRLVDAMNAMAVAPLVVRTSGGPDGGGTKLTDQCLRLIAAFRSIEAAHKAFLEAVMLPADL
ncbi:MAG: winged helix-turn-helix domain-containing protein [Flavobacteriales bacterium]|nr:winged helix-turn-helix domain-containing protein [Flavobacteriales bacterium]MBK6892874.1 winged helix-turn-helix domain-containing protein [Flavobacteriales bacterium]MBK7247385.1 winged helix-turn-helix domain-containing protein [Flavobacteriales bacterium]MBK9596754.1 winged helix-turn-helix domain-containing protein [Flavobacteriales bacterium]QQS72678.1 MAG: winged helix-turn-helix domain-containing protein [Flavobacteriales bacterium]